MPDTILWVEFLTLVRCETHFWVVVNTAAGSTVFPVSVE